MIPDPGATGTFDRDEVEAGIAQLLERRERRAALWALLGVTAGGLLSVPVLAAALLVLGLVCGPPFSNVPAAAAAIRWSPP
jgi:hypothetical protein